MIGNLEPEVHVMDESVKFPSSVLNKIAVALEALGWDYNDDIEVEIGGSSVYGIDGAGTKWAPLLGTVKYNKDAFIVIKNRSRNPIVPSQVNPDLKAHHAE